MRSEPRWALLIPFPKLGRALTWASAVAASGLVLLSLGCGGGGGGTSGQTSNPPPPPPPANTVAVGQGGMSFVPSSLTIKAGETVTWNWVSSGHTVDSGSSCTADGLFSSGTLNAGGTFTHTFSTPGTYPYFCIPHCTMGMTGNILVDAANTTILVGPSGTMTFSPAALTIRKGQTVTWTWASSGHSVDSGSSCTADSTFTSGGLQNSGFSFSHTFTTPGTYSYFCAPHCSMGMTGTITVKP